MQDPISELQRLRHHRQRSPRDLTITSLIETEFNRAKKAQHSLGELAEIWADLVPAPLRDQTGLVAFRGSVLHVAADSSSIAFELDRLLRERLLQDLRNRFGGTLSRVKVQLGTPPES